MALIAALLAVAYLSPAAFAGDKNSKNNKDQTSAQNAPVTSAPVEPSATKVAHDGRDRKSVV